VHNHLYGWLGVLQRGHSLPIADTVFAQGEQKQTRITKVVSAREWLYYIALPYFTLRLSPTEVPPWHVGSLLLYFAPWVVSGIRRIYRVALKSQPISLIIITSYKTASEARFSPILSIKWTQECYKFVFKYVWSNLWHHQLLCFKLKYMGKLDLYDKIVHFKNPKK